MVTPNIHTSEEWEKEPTRRLSGAHLEVFQGGLLVLFVRNNPGWDRFPTALTKQTGSFCAPTSRSDPSLGSILA